MDQKEVWEEKEIEIWVRKFTKWTLNNIFSSIMLEYK